VNHQQIGDALRYCRHPRGYGDCAGRTEYADFAYALAILSWSKAARNGTRKLKAINPRAHVGIADAAL